MFEKAKNNGEISSVHNLYELSMFFTTIINETVYLSSILPNSNLKKLFDDI